MSSIGVGGGSLIDADSGVVGPQSVGFRITDEALVFGGRQLTLTDIAVAAGRAEIGDRARVNGLDASLIARVDAHLRARLSRLLENYDRLDRKLPIILVGGGAPLILHLLRELGRQVESPADAAVANAYGAAMAQVGGEADLTFSSSVPRQEALARAEAEAHRRAEEAGARPGTIRTVELEDAALTLPRIGGAQGARARGRRHRRGARMSFEIRRGDLSALALGSGILGTGGGGNSYYGQLVASQVLGEGSSVRVIDVNEMDPEAFAIRLGRHRRATGLPRQKPPSLRAMQL